MELADAKGPDTAQRFTLARLTLSASHVQLFKPPSSLGAYDVAAAKRFIGEYLRKPDRWLEDEKAADIGGGLRRRGRSPIGSSSFNGDRARTRFGRGRKCDGGPGKAVPPGAQNRWLSEIKTKAEFGRWPFATDEMRQ
jgi:hypothetical protein